MSAKDQQGINNNAILHPYTLNGSAAQTFRLADDNSPYRAGGTHQMSNFASNPNLSNNNNKRASQFHGFGSVDQLNSFITSPFSTPEIDENLKQQQYQGVNNLSTIKRKSGSSFASPVGNSVNVFNLYNNSYNNNYNNNSLGSAHAFTTAGNNENSNNFYSNFAPKNIFWIKQTIPQISLNEGAREGMEQRQKLFVSSSNNNRDQKDEIEESPIDPDQHGTFSEKSQSPFSSQQQQQLQQQNVNQLLQLSINQQQELTNAKENTSKQWRKESVNTKTYKTGTIAFTNLLSTKKIWQRKWMVMSHFISKSISSFKKILMFSKPTQLTALQMRLINDKCVYYLKLRESKAKRYQGWLFQSDGCVSRKWKKKILISLKGLKGFQSVVLRVSKCLVQGMRKFDAYFPPLSPLSLGIKIFDILIFIYTIFIALFAPLFLCFRLNHGFFDSNIFILNTLSPVIFAVDSLKYLNTACFIRGQIIKSRPQIISAYLRDRFIWDILSFTALVSFESDPIFGNDFTLVFYYFRLIFGVNIINKLRDSFLLHEKTHAVINIGILISLIYCFAHLFACFWFYIGAQQAIHMGVSWVDQISLLQASLADQYLNSLYFAISSMSLLNSTVVAQTSYEKLYLVLINTLIFTVLAFCFQEGYTIFESISLKRKNYLSQLKQINRQIEF